MNDYNLVCLDSDEKLVAVKEKNYIALQALYSSLPDRQLNKPGGNLYRAILTKIANARIEINDVNVESILNILINLLIDYNYDIDRAWNEDVYRTKSVSNYVLLHTDFAIKKFHIKRRKEGGVTVFQPNGEKVYIPFKKFSLDAAIPGAEKDGTSFGDIITDEESSCTLGDPQANASLELGSEIVDGENKSLVELADRLIYFSEYTDTNFCIIIYARLKFDLLCINSNYAYKCFKEVLDILEMTNFLNEADYRHDSEFLELSSHLGKIGDTEKFTDILAKRMYCGKEISNIVNWLARQVG